MHCAAQWHHINVEIISMWAVVEKSFSSNIYLLFYLYCCAADLSLLLTSLSDTAPSGHVLNCILQIYSVDLWAQAQQTLQGTEDTRFVVDMIHNSSFPSTDVILESGYKFHPIRIQNFQRICYFENSWYVIGKKSWTTFFSLPYLTCELKMNSKLLPRQCAAAEGHHIVTVA